MVISQGLLASPGFIAHFSFFNEMFVGPIGFLFQAQIQPVTLVNNSCIHKSNVTLAGLSEPYIGREVLMKYLQIP